MMKAGCSKPAIELQGCLNVANTGDFSKDAAEHRLQAWL